MRLWPFRTAAKSLAEPTAEEYLIFTGIPPQQGLIGNAEALTVPAIQRAIFLISGSIASFDVIVERLEDGAWQRDETHEVAQLLANDPNDWQSWHELLRDLIATALTNDAGSIAYVNRVDGDRIAEVIRYDIGHYQIDYSNDGRQEPTFKIDNRTVSARNVIHLRSLYGKSPLTLSLGTATLLKSLEKQSRNLMRRAGRPGGVISTPKPIGDDGAKSMLKGWKAAHEGPDSSGRTAVLWDGATWAQVTLSAVDQQFIETWKFVILEVARHFGVPPQMLYDFDRATWGNAEHAGKEWLASLELWMQPLEASLRRALFSSEDRKKYRVRFNRDDYSNVDLTARATAGASLIASRAMSPNEVRTELLDLPKGPPELDAFVNPNTGASQPGNVAHARHERQHAKW